jgi:hypothetical protein
MDLNNTKSSFHLHCADLGFEDSCEVATCLLNIPKLLMQPNSKELENALKT